ncbi:MAG: ribosomal protein S18-alanine N-acetyltransferase [Chloroflexi bacterium]|nr:ribosomal protein S18-alanine N-acetyltransferase [Chloroflexota bacterium]
MEIVAQPFQIRTIRREDIRQVLEVERDAFPTLWPPTSFKKEMQNRLARYLVAVRPRTLMTEGVSDSDETRGPDPLASDPEPSYGAWRRWLEGLRRLLPSMSGSQSREFLLGYLGLWRIADDSHIISVGVRTPHRRLGVGESLVIRAIETSLDWRIRFITLEVRVSNFAAQALYEKYGFKKMGVRKRYYKDNNEDALIMTTDPIETEEYQREFQYLKAVHAEKLARHLVLDIPVTS